VTPVVENAFTADIKRLQDTLTADQAGELTRLADGLSKTRTPGAIAGDISAAINTDGLKAVAEFQVVRDRLAKIGTPDQVRVLDEAVLGGVPTNERGRLKYLLRPKKTTTNNENTNFSAGTDDGDETGRAEDGSGTSITIRMPEGQDDLSISVDADATDEEKAAALQAIADVLKTQKSGGDGASDDLIKDVGEGVLSLVPGVGNALSAKDANYAFQAAAEAFEKGDLSEAGIQAALGAIDTIGAIPGPGNLVKGTKEIVGLMIKGGRRFLKKNAPTPKGNTSPSTLSPDKGPELGRAKKLSLRKSDHKPQSLSNENARYFYNERVKIAKQKNAEITNLKEGALDGHQIRNRERTLARDLMKDRKEAMSLELKYPNLTFEQLVKRAKKKGLVGDAIYERIRETAFKPNAAVTKKLLHK